MDSVCDAGIILCSENRCSMGGGGGYSECFTVLEGGGGGLLNGTV